MLSEHKSNFHPSDVKQTIEIFNQHVRRAKDILQDYLNTGENEIEFYMCLEREILPHKISEVINTKPEGSSDWQARKLLLTGLRDYIECKKRYWRNVNWKESLLKARNSFYLATTKSNNPIAWLFLGKTYDVFYEEKDAEKISRYYQRAVEHPRSAIQYTMQGMMFQNGEGGYPQDLSKAIICFNKAIKMNDPNALCRLAEVYLEQFEQHQKCCAVSELKESKEPIVEKEIKPFHLSPQEIAFLFHESALRGYPGALVKLAELFNKGFGVEKNPEIAKAYYEDTLDYSRKLYGFINEEVSRSRIIQVWLYASVPFYRRNERQTLDLIYTDKVMEYNSDISNVEKLLNRDKETPISTEQIYQAYVHGAPEIERSDLQTEEYNNRALQSADFIKYALMDSHNQIKKGLWPPVQRHVENKIYAYITQTKSSLHQPGLPILPKEIKETICSYLVDNSHIIRTPFQIATDYLNSVLVNILNDKEQPKLTKASANKTLLLIDSLKTKSDSEKDKLDMLKEHCFKQLNKGGLSPLLQKVYKKICEVPQQKPKNIGFFVGTVVTVAAIATGVGAIVHASISKLNVHSKK